MKDADLWQGRVNQALAKEEILKDSARRTARMGSGKVYQVGDIIQSELISPRRIQFDTLNSDAQMHRLIQQEFITEEPWGRDVVTNGSVHRYLSVPQSADAMNVFFNTPEGLEIRAKKINASTYASGCISTQLNPKFQLKNREYVYVELKVPYSTGLWPAFWLLPAFRTWPAAYSGMVLPEIDPAEFIKLFQRNEYSTNVHTYNTPNPIRDLSTLNDHQVKHICPSNYDFTENFHFFGCMRDEQFIYLTLNHKVINRVPMFRETIMAGPWCILLNLAVGGTWPGNPDATTNLDRGFSIRSLKIGGYNYDKPVTTDPLDPGAENPNRDVILMLNELETVTKDKACAAIKECFDQKRATLS